MMPVQAGQECDELEAAKASASSFVLRTHGMNLIYSSKFTFK